MLSWSTLNNLFFPKDFFDTYLDNTNFTSFWRAPDLEQACFDQILVSSHYWQTQHLLERAKFGAEIAIIPDLAKIMTQALQKQIKQGLIDSPELLTFVPTDPKRWQERGYHLPQLLTKHLSHQLKIPYLDLFDKTNSTQAQTHLNREQRLVNLKDAFTLKAASLTNLTRICLIDDVTTTGSTLNQCAQTLLQNHGFLKIFGLVLASN